MRRKVLCALLALAAALTLCACSKKSQTPAPTATPLPSPAAAAAAMPTPVADAIPSAVLSPLQTPKPTRSPAPETPMPLATLAPKPTATPAATPLPEPAATPAALAAAQSNAPVVTKQPNGEGHYVGESAVFITSALNYTSLHWTAVSPSGREIDMKTFRETFPDCSVIGEKDTTLTITNLNIDMSGWSFFCTFENEEASTQTASARLRVRDPESSTTTTGGGTVVTTKSKRLRCPGCGSEVPRDLLNCPYCGAEIYTQNEYAYVMQDQTGDIFYMDNTGAMHFDSSTRISTYVDTNTNYTVFDDSGLIQSGNYKKEEEKAKEEAILQSFLTEAGY